MKTFIFPEGIINTVLLSVLGHDETVSSQTGVGRGVNGYRNGSVDMRWIVTC